MPKRSKPSVSPDTLALNPAYADALEGGDWESEPDSRKRDGRQTRDKKEMFIDAVREFAPSLPMPVGQGGRADEFHPIPGRRHQVDYAWPDWRVIVEVDGGNMGVAQIKKGRNAGKWIPTGRHTKDEDYWKMNELVALGYAVFRFTTTQLRHRKSAAECVYQVTYYLKSKGYI